MLPYLNGLLKQLRHVAGGRFYSWRKNNYYPVRDKILNTIGRDTYYRVKRKLVQGFEKCFPFNGNYKPNGIYKTSKDYFTQNPNLAIEYLEIYPHCVSTLPMTEELYDACADYAKPKLEVETDYLLVKIPNGRVYSDNMGSVAIISHDNKLLGDVSFQYKEGNVVAPQQNLIFSQNYFLPPLKVKGTAFTMLSGGGAINNYGHWLMDALPRLHLLKESGLFNQVDWFIVPSIRYDYQRDSLRLLGIPLHKVIEGDKFRHFQADSLIASTAPRGNYAIIPDWVFDFLRKSFLGVDENKQDYPSRIHISRKDSKFRNVLNEDEMEDLITPYGFQTVALSKLSFLEKVNLFAHADVVLGASGAGLTNIFFCKQGCKLVELFSEGFVLTDYIDIAHKARMDYNYVISKSLSQVKSKKQGQRDHMIIDLRELKKVLDKVLVTRSKDTVI